LNIRQIMPTRNAKNRRSRKQKARTQPKTAKLLSNVTSSLPGNGCCLSKASTDYLKCLLNPADGPLVGVPDGSIVLTRKVRTWSRGSFTCAASGSTDACVMLNLNGLFSSTPYCVYAGQPTVAQTMNQPAPGGLIATNSNAPYDNNFFSVKGQARVAAATLRVRYVGTELNKGGTILGIQEPNHGSVVGMTTAGMLGYPSGKRVSINQMKNGEWFELNYIPADVNDTYFVNSVTGSSVYASVYYNDGVACSWDIYPFIGCYISNPVASAVFEFEAFGVVEYAGPLVSPKTVTIPDTQGFHSVLASLSQAVEHAGRTPETSASGSLSTPGFLNRVFNTANKLLTDATPRMVEMGSQAFSRYGPSVAAAAAQRLLNWTGGSRASPSPRQMLLDNYLEPI